MDDYLEKKSDFLGNPTEEREKRKKNTQKKVREKRKIENKKINKISNKDKIFHFFDDHSGWMKGITFSKDEKKIESIMCTNNIVCHKVPNPNNDTISEKKYKYLLNNYISKIIFFPNEIFLFIKSTVVP